jgi:hypothetical protein
LRQRRTLQGRWRKNQTRMRAGNKMTQWPAWKKHIKLSPKAHGHCSVIHIDLSTSSPYIRVKSHLLGSTALKLDWRAGQPNSCWYNRPLFEHHQRQAGPILRILQGIPYPHGCVMFKMDISFTSHDWRKIEVLSCLVDNPWS